MPRSHARTTYLFSSILACVVIAATTVAAQSNIPTKLAVSSAQRTVGVREQTELRIRLLDQAGNETAATYDTSVTLIATRQKDIDTAKRDARGKAAFQRNGTLALPDGINTAQTIVTIHQGQSAAALQFSSHQAGSVRIYAENEKLVTGATLIAIVVRTGKATIKTSRMADAAMFQMATFQRRTPATTAPAPVAPPAPVPNADAAASQLEIEPDGVRDAELNGQMEYVRRFSVLLKSGGDIVPATQDTEVRLRIVKGAGELSQNFFVIPKDSFIYPADDKLIELRTKSGGNIEVEATVVRRAGVSVQSSPAVAFKFPTTIRATKLQVEAIPLAAMANGIESIKLRIRPVDAGNNPVRNEDEGLEVRHVTLSLANRTLGLKFENGATSIPIKRGETFIETSVISSCPVAGAKIVAETENGDRHMIWGEQKLEFCFPWTQLGGAMFGGLMFPLVLTVFPGKQRERRFAGGKLRKISLYGLAGLLLGALAFALVFFGALGLTEFNFNGIPITIARLPIHNVLAACAIGFFGGVMLATGISLKERAQKGEPEGGESPAQA